MFASAFKLLALLTFTAATAASPIPAPPAPTSTVTVTEAFGRGGRPTLPVVTGFLPLDSLPSPVPFGSSGPGNNGGKCTTGKLQCCETMQHPQSKEARDALSGLLGAALGNLTGQVGLQCNALSVIGAGNGASCQARTVCCDSTANGGVVGIGCVPITL